MRNKKAQVTLFVIISVLIAVAIVSYFIFKPTLFLGISSTSNPEGFIEKCVSDSLAKTENLLFENNLKINQNFTNYFLYNSEKVPYYCTTSEFYVACMPQEPTLFISTEKTLENRLLRDVNECFTKLETDLKSKGYSVSSSALILNLSLLQDSIKVNLNKKISAVKGENSFTIDDFEFSNPSSLYEIIKTAQTITNYESTLCEFNEINWMKSMPRIIIKKFVASESTKVYILTDRITEKQTKFAIKTCVLPAGI